MRIIPVLDIKNGQVVHGIAGRRQEYQPIRSALTPSTRPVDVARAFRDMLGLRECYVADLDAIAGSVPSLSVYAEIQALGIRLWVDAGIREAEQAMALARASVDTVVVGLETIAGPESLETICASLASSRVLFSLDLKNGVPVGNVKNWQGKDAKSIGLQAIRLGIRRLLVLDLARVGMGVGTQTDGLCSELLCEHPDLELVAGGGIRDASDLRKLKQIGLAAVLIASALHDGRLKPQDWSGI